MRVIITIVLSRTVGVYFLFFAHCWAYLDWRVSIADCLNDLAWAYRLQPIILRLPQTTCKHYLNIFPVKWNWWRYDGRSNKYYPFLVYYIVVIASYRTFGNKTKIRRKPKWSKIYYIRILYRYICIFASFFSSVSILFASNYRVRLVVCCRHFSAGY